VGRPNDSSENASTFAWNRFQNVRQVLQTLDRPATAESCAGSNRRNSMLSISALALESAGRSRVGIVIPTVFGLTFPARSC